MGEIGVVDLFDGRVRGSGAIPLLDGQQVLERVQQPHDPHSLIIRHPPSRKDTLIPRPDDLARAQAHPSGKRRKYFGRRMSNHPLERRRRRRSPWLREQGQAFGREGE